jgi:uncharacterized protein (DUF58 family)
MIRTDYRRYLNPSVVAKLSNIELKAKFVVQGFMAGLHKSPYHGFSVEFTEHRQYTQGDDLRYLDWKVLARTGRYYIKQYEEETNLKAYIILDISRSMSYVSDRKEKENGKFRFFKVKNNTREQKNGLISKIEYSSYLAASLAYLMMIQRDAVSLITYDTKIRTFLPPKSTQGNLKQILKELSRIQPEGATGTAESLNSIAEKIKKRGLIILISDLLDDPDKVINALRHFRYNRNEVILFQILDPSEKYFLDGGSLVLVDMETGEEMFSQTDTIQAYYRDSIKKFIDKYKKECIRNNIDYELLTTDTPFDISLLRYLNKRKKLN